MRTLPAQFDLEALLTVVRATVWARRLAGRCSLVEGCSEPASVAGNSAQPRPTMMHPWGRSDAFPG